MVADPSRHVSTAQSVLLEERLRPGLGLGDP
jgi:hypothetical protein